MGPGDPFAAQGGWTPPSAEEDDGGADAPIEEPAAQATDDAANAAAGLGRLEPSRRAMAIGLLIGLAFGVVVVMGGVVAALVIGAFGLVGLAAGWIVWSVLNDRLDVRGAIRALRRRP